VVGLSEPQSRQRICALVSALKTTLTVARPVSISSKLHLKGESTAFELRVEQEVGLNGEYTPRFAVNKAAPLGVWHGSLDGLPGVTLTLADDSGEIGGTVVCYALVD